VFTGLEKNRKCFKEFVLLFLPVTTCLYFYTNKEAASSQRGLWPSWRSWSWLNDSGGRALAAQGHGHALAAAGSWLTVIQPMPLTPSREKRAGAVPAPGKQGENYFRDVRTRIHIHDYILSLKISIRRL
jgi:hypothetical protein